MSQIIKAFPELFSESVEAKIYAVASRDYSGSLTGPPGFYPQYTEPNGPAPHVYQYTPVRFWTSGFFPGSIWLLCERAKILGVSSGHITLEKWLRLAKFWTEPLKALSDRRDTHDIGFFFMPTYYKYMRYDSEASVEAKDVVLKVADNLASRFNPVVGCTRSWDRSGHLINGVSREDMDKHFLVIIDNMMNLDLLYTARFLSSSQGMTTSPSPSLAEIATTHAYTTIQNHFHSNGGTYHVLNYNQTPNTEPRIFKRWAAQGFSDDSVWARGQAWAIHGFARCAEWTDILHRWERTGRKETALGWGNLEAAVGGDKFEGEVAFVDQARRAADYFIAHLGEGKESVPPWDFDAPNNPDGSLTFRDVSAGMIAASGMITLHTILKRMQPPTSPPSPYLSAALKIVRATLRFCSTPRARFLPGSTIVDLGDGGWDTILNQSTINYNANAAKRWADCGLVYADYYFLEVGNKLLEMERRGWLVGEDFS